MLFLNRGDYVDFGKRLKECRTSKGLRQTDLGKKIGVSGQVISNLERGYTTGSSPEMIRKIANALDVSVEYLTGNEFLDRYALNNKDKRNIAKTLDTLMEQIENNENEPLNYNGEEVDPEDMELLKDAIGIALKRIKKKNKEKYTPNKYKE